MCGASARADAANCQHCGSRLATIACPACFGMMFLGAKFCSHCGAPAARASRTELTKHLCPRCKSAMDPVQVGTSSLEECGRCHGVWADKQTVEQICASSEQQAAVLGIASVETKEQEMELEEKIRYVPCPDCGQLMNRVHFANCSKVIVDVCKAHGTWFDKDELRRIVEFIRSGGLTLAREREIAALEAKRKRLLETPSPGGPATPEPLSIPSASADLGDIVVAAGKLLDLFF